MRERQSYKSIDISDDVIQQVYDRYQLKLDLYRHDEFVQFPRILEYSDSLLLNPKQDNYCDKITQTDVQDMCTERKDIIYIKIKNLYNLINNIKYDLNEAVRINQILLDRLCSTS